MSSLTSQQLLIESHGTPQSVLSLVTAQLSGNVQGDEILVDILAAPINPSDVNMVEGKYPIKPQLPAVPGFEGVGRIRQAGRQVTSLAVGDWVIPKQPGQGTWRQAGVFKADAWHKVPKTIPVQAAATLFVNPPSALRMLEEFVELHPGDCVVQNGANSAVGQFVVQLAALRGVSSVNVIRDRPDRSAVEQHLRALGATLVTTEAALRKDMEAAGLPAARLGLNCVGGSAATAVAKALCPGGVLVTYGGMSLQPVVLPTSLLIFKDITARGFWLSNAAKDGGSEARLLTVDRIAQLYVDGQLRPNRTEAVPLEGYQDAFERYYAGFTGAKMLFMPNPHLLPT